MIDWKNEKDRLDYLINKEKLSYLEIGRQYGVSDNCIKKHAKKLGIELPIRNLINHERVPHNKGKRSINSIKKEKNYIKKYNQKSHAKTHNELIKKYNFPLNEISPGQCSVCGKFNCTDDFCKKHNFQQLIGFVIHLGFDSTKIGTKEVKEEFNRVSKMIYNLYWNENYSLTDLEQKFNYKRIIPAKTMDNLEVPRRSFSEANKTALLTGKRNLQSPKHNHIFKNKIIHHITWDGREVCLRSSYEEDFANLLDLKQIKYYVEKIRIKYLDTTRNGEERIAVPDFYLPDTNELIEIKSDFTLDIENLILKFEEYKKNGYTPKLILEHKEIDLYNIENLINNDRLLKIKNKNLRKWKEKNNFNP